MELQYLPTVDGQADYARLDVQWLGPMLTLPMAGGGGTAQLDIESDDAAAAAAATTTPSSRNQQLSLQFGRCLIYQEQWRTVTLRNRGK